jgi:hypothetical protein
VAFQFLPTFFERHNVTFHSGKEKSVLVGHAVWHFDRHNNDTPICGCDPLGFAGVSEAENKLRPLGVETAHPARWGRFFWPLLYHAFDFLHVRDVALGPI